MMSMGISCVVRSLVRLTQRRLKVDPLTPKETIPGNQFSTNG
jgi:hypothetical protein